MNARQLYYAKEVFSVPTILDRPARSVIEEVMSAFECFAPDDGCTYLSSEITTGRRFYTLLREHGVRSREELKEKLGSDYRAVWRSLMDENLAAGHDFFDGVAAGERQTLINPGPFYADGWQQEHYLYLWEWVIVNKCFEARFNEGWNYSNGCTLEYAISLRKGIPTCRPDGQSLDAHEAMELIESAVSDLDSSDIPAPKLRENLQRIRDAT